MAMTTHDLSTFGALLKTFRHRQHRTQQQLAHAVGVHRRTLVRWEQGDYLPESKTMVLELARHLQLHEQETRQLLEASLTALSPYWCVPLPRNPFFTGREEILEALHAQLRSEQAVALTQSSALHGLGGVGKTQIALEYAYRYGLEYSAVFWIGAETEEQMRSSLLHIAEVLQLPERAGIDQQRVGAAVQRWLSTHGQWLLIWDNVEELALLDRVLPVVRSGALLLTTRCQVLGTFARGIDLAPMEPEEGVLFLLRRAKLLESTIPGEHLQQVAERLPAQYAAASDLVKALGGLPLALDQAGAYLEATRCGLQTYLELFRSRRADLLQQRGEGTRDHPASVSTTFTLAITATAERHPAVRDLLQVCALLQPDAIPEELFRQGSEHLGPQLQAVCRDHLEWERVVSIACSYSLLFRQSEDHTLSLHRLVQAVLLESMTEREQEIWSRRVIEALDGVMPEILTGADAPSRKQAARLLPHALLCLQRSERTEAWPALASLTYKVALTLRAQGRYTEAEPALLRALHLQEQALGVHHSTVATLLNVLALLYWQQGTYEQADGLFRRALHIREQTSGMYHPETAITLNDLANLLRDQGKYAEAESLHQRALAIREQVLGPDHPQTASSLNNLALLYKSQGRYTEAKPLLQRALSILEQTLAPHDLALTYTLNNLATLYWVQDQPAEAEPFYQRALRIREQVLGPEHPETAVPLNNLAVIAQLLGKDAEAEALFQRAMQIWERSLGLDHPFMTTALEDCADLYKKQGRYTEAEALLHQALRNREHTVGPDHPETAGTLNHLAMLYWTQGSYVEAEALLQQALAIREQHLGQQHPETAQSFHDLALLRKSQGHLQEARALAEQALTIRSQALGEAHPKTGATRTLYAQLGQQQADGTERTVEDLGSLLKARGWSMHLKKRRNKPYVYATRKVGKHTQSRYLAPLSNLAACLAAARALPNAKEG